VQAKRSCYNRGMNTKEQRTSTLTVSRPGQRIRAARAYAGISEQQLADEIGTTVGALKGWSRSFASPPPLMLDRIADVCGMDRQWLRDGYRRRPSMPARR